FFSPTEVFRSLRRHPRFLAALILITLFSTIYSNLFTYILGADRLVNYTIDKTLESPFVASNEDAKKRIEESRSQSIEDAKDPKRRAFQAVATFVGILFVN